MALLSPIKNIDEPTEIENQNDIGFTRDKKVFDFFYILFKSCLIYCLRSTTVFTKPKYYNIGLYSDII